MKKMNVERNDQLLFDQSFSNKVIRKKFISKVLSIIALELGITIAVSLLFIFVEGLKSFAIKNPGFLYLALIGALAILIILSCFQSIARTYPINLILLTFHAVLEGVSVGFISAFLETTLVAYAFIITATAVITIVAFSKFTDIDFTRCQPLLCLLSLVHLIMMIILILIIILLGENFRFWYMILCAAAALISMFYLAIEVQLIIGGKRYEINPEDYIFAALCIYIDLINIYVYILQILRYFNEQ